MFKIPRRDFYSKSAYLVSFSIASYKQEMCESLLQKNRK